MGKRVAKGYPCGLRGFLYLVGLWLVGIRVVDLDACA